MKERYGDALIYALFCVHKFGWGWKSFIEEADAGEGMRFPKGAKLYVTYLLPAIIAILFIVGMYQQLLA